MNVGPTLAGWRRGRDPRPSQASIAKAIGVDQSAVSLYESGREVPDELIPAWLDALAATHEERGEIAARIRQEAAEQAARLQRVALQIAPPEVAA